MAQLCNLSPANIDAAESSWVDWFRLRTVLLSERADRFPFLLEGTIS